MTSIKPAAPCTVAREEIVKRLESKYPKITAENRDTTPIQVRYFLDPEFPHAEYGLGSLAARDYGYAQGPVRRCVCCAERAFHESGHKKCTCTCGQPPEDAKDAKAECGALARLRVLCECASARLRTAVDTFVMKQPAPEKRLKLALAEYDYTIKLGGLDNIAFAGLALCRGRAGQKQAIDQTYAKLYEIATLHLVIIALTLFECTTAKSKNTTMRRRRLFMIREMVECSEPLFVRRRVCGWCSVCETPLLCSFRTHKLFCSIDCEQRAPASGHETGCYTCGKKEVLFQVCGQCKNVAYCSKVCQKNDFACHKAECKTAQEKKESKE